MAIRTGMFKEQAAIYGKGPRSVEDVRCAVGKLVEDYNVQ
jgi:hypothetical protein